ncbi:MAG: hypothetical protein RLZZ524_1625 [Pseudomonadota bacterium]|jgi:hypothetical protein
MGDTEIHLAARRATERQAAQALTVCRCQPTIEHHFAARESRARCWRCGATTQPIPWGADFPPRDMNDRCINAFREEHHHAD